MPAPASLKVIGVWLVGSTCGCSLTFMNTVPADAARGQARPHVDCTTGYAAPIIDSVLATNHLIGVGYAATHNDSDYEPYPISRQTHMALAAGYAALFAGSAVYGYVSAAHCRRVKSGPPSDGYLPGVSAGSRGEKTADASGLLISAHGASLMVHRPDPEGAVRKR
jgi:hypothetical protein